MLANDGADVYSVDINSIYLFRGGRLHKCEGETPESCVRKSSVVVTGVPTKAYRLPTEWIQPNTTGKDETCLDVETRISIVWYDDVHMLSYSFLWLSYLHCPFIVVNVASFKNVDEESLLKVPGVTYVPMVGKVTVAMLERNLVRLYENFHHPDVRLKAMRDKEEAREGADAAKFFPWYEGALQLYTAAAVTALLAITISRSK